MSSTRLAVSKLCTECGTLMRLDIGTGRHPNCDPEFRALDRLDRARRRVVTQTAGCASNGPRAAVGGTQRATVASGPEIMISRKHPATSHRMARLVQGIRADILRALVRQGPLTDYELEAVLRRSHQSVSGGRRRCAIDELVEDTGKRRTNRYGNNVIVWAITRKGIASIGGA